MPAVDTYSPCAVPLLCPRATSKPSPALRPLATATWRHPCGGEHRDRLGRNGPPRKPNDIIGCRTVARLARFLAAEDPRHEIPPAGCSMGAAAFRSRYLQ